MADKDMPRRSVVSEIAERHRMTKVEAERVLRTALGSIARQLAIRGRFHVAEIGSISVSERNPRRYFNPRTREESVSDGDSALKIRVSKAMRRKLRDNPRTV